MPVPVRVRFAPSPTGYLHVGGGRTALYNWLFARKTGGRFILRIEDTDVERSTAEAADAILEGLTWLGLDWDEGPFRQAERLERYRLSAERLEATGRAYRCTCTPEELEERRRAALAVGQSPRYDRRCRDQGPVPNRPWALRLKIPDTGTTVIQDLIHGEVRFANAELDDFILLRSDGLPTYNFAVVVDDGEMGITHVIRGDDHLSNTPRQIHVYEALGFALPAFAHIPMILGPDRARLSKRHGATSVLAYRDLGYLPEAIVNYLARLGWSHGDQEIFSTEELIQHFSLERVGKAPAVFDRDKLDWVNGHYLRVRDPEWLGALLTPFWEHAGVPIAAVRRREAAWRESGAGTSFAAAAVLLFRERARTLKELAENSRFLFDLPVSLDPALVRKHLAPDVRALLCVLVKQLAGLDKFEPGVLEAAYRQVAAERQVKLGPLAQATRLIVTGTVVSPPLFEVMALIGRGLCLARLRAVLGGGMVGGGLEPRGHRIAEEGR